MAWRIVKQPNGLYARFSDIVDHFTHYNMDRETAIKQCKQEPGMGEAEARDKVAGADIDDVWGRVERVDGLNCWLASLKTIERVHGPIESALAEVTGQEGAP